jgi:GntR family transcriptional regulator
MVERSFGAGVANPSRKLLGRRSALARAAADCLGTGHKVVQFSWTRTGPDGPHALAFVYVTEPVAKLIPKDWARQLQAAQLLHRVERICGVRADRVRQRSSAIAADAASALALMIEPGTPLLLLERTYFAPDGTVLEHSRILGRADRCQQTVELFRVAG